MSSYITECRRKTKVNRQYEVVVAGGGIAGISAALSAARNGAKVLLIEQGYLLGGLATAGLITIYLPLCDGKGRQVSFGIAEELLRLSVQHGCEGAPCEEWLKGTDKEARKKRRFEVQYNPYIFAIEAEKLLVENGVTLLYGSRVCDVVKKCNRITHLIIENKSGREAVEAQMVIDATGDADVCYLAGEETVCFRQGNTPASWYYAVKNGENHLKMLGVCDIPDSHKKEEDFKNTQKLPRFTGLDADELTRLTLLSHRTLLADFLKGGEDSQKHSLSTIATIPQVRMTRRIAGVYTQDDVEMHQEYDDSVGLFSDWRKAGPVYELPFSALYGNRIVNLIAAGRCISGTEAMWNITRVIPVCAVSGQAAGTAAAISREFAKTDIKELQRRLVANQVVLHEKDL